MLMGGQACVFYGAAEFSRDLDLLILVDVENLERLRRALNELKAESVAVPHLDAAVLNRGHAVHFRCHAEGAAGLRIDLMSILRNGAPFGDLWARRTTIESDGVEIDMLSIEDLIRAKKTQRDKDWPMVQRLVERAWIAGEGSPQFWLTELRSADLLLDATKRYRDDALAIAATRPAVAAALNGDIAEVDWRLEEEERKERQLDRDYWKPLRAEMEGFRRERRSSQPGEFPAGSKPG
jgi:hypothetical protein